MRRTSIFIVFVLISGNLSAASFSLDSITMSHELKDVRSLIPMMHHTDTVNLTHKLEQYLKEKGARGSKLEDVSSSELVFQLYNNNKVYDNLQLKVKVEKLEQDLDRKNAWIAIVIGSTSLASIASILLFCKFRKKRNLALLLSEKNIEIQRLNQLLEIKVLRSQMNPHFIYNALNGLQLFLANRNDDFSVDYLLKLSWLMRKILQNATKDWIEVKEEMEMLELYLQIEQSRFPSKFDFTIMIESGVERELIPFMVIQPYVENAVLHGLAPRQKPGGFLTIYSRRIDGRLVVTLTDNGVGRQASRHKQNSHISMGSKLVSDRLMKLSVQSGLLMNVEFEDMTNGAGLESGTKVIFTFEIQALTKSIVA